MFIHPYRAMRRGGWEPLSGTYHRGDGGPKVPLAREPGRVYSRGLMENPQPSPLPETRDRVCPYWSNHVVVALGRILASATGVRGEYRCGHCSRKFVVLQRSG